MYFHRWIERETTRPNQSTGWRRTDFLKVEDGKTKCRTFYSRSSLHTLADILLPVAPSCLVANNEVVALLNHPSRPDYSEVPMTESCSLHYLSTQINLDIVSEKHRQRYNDRSS